METENDPTIVHDRSVADIVRDANRSEIHRNTGISLSGVSRILGGKRTPRTTNLMKVAAQLGVTMDELYNYLTRSRRKRKRAA